MYCFPYPEESDVTPLRVPYIANTHYTLGGPSSFTEFFGAVPSILFQHALSLARTGAMLSPPRNFAGSFVQSWLFFGLASEALGRNVQHEEFTEPHAVGTSNSSIDLRMPVWFRAELRTRWKKLQDSLSESEYEQEKRDLLECFTCAITKACELDLIEDDRDGNGGDSELPLVLLSIHMLLYLLTDLLNVTMISRTDLRCKSTHVLVERMLKNGWCRKRLNFIGTANMFYPALYFMSSFRPPGIRNEDHRQCTAQKCYVTKGLMKPLHRTSDCQCQDVHVPIEDVTRIVDTGGIPLIRIARSEDGSLGLEVLPYKRTRHFTAISHVWADQQFGSAKNALPQCQVEYLDSVLAALPPEPGFSSLRDYVSKRFIRPQPTGTIDPPSRACKFFWLDTFCIPQSLEHDRLKNKAIESMNLIYAAAADTLVFDAALQAFDAGQRPSSLMHGGRATFHSPTDQSLTDVLARICASNWMSRAWTLQEGILSGSLVFPLNGSFAFLKLLRPNLDSQVTTSGMMSAAGRVLGIGWMFEQKRTSWMHATDDAELFRSHVWADLFRFAKRSLNVEEYRAYARESTSRAALFVKSHRLLQSRSTTQSADVPLILVNMSGMNGNLVSQSNSTDERMKLLFYGLESLPAELLFSECARLGRCEVDAWIPREIVPETFSGQHTLQLESEGFTFRHKNDISLKFFLLSWSESPSQVLIPLNDDDNSDKQKQYVIEDSMSPAIQPTVTPVNGHCIVVDDTNTKPRGARFVVTSMIGNKVFLHYDCPIRLFRRDGHGSDRSTTNMSLNDVRVAQIAGPQLEFIIEKSSTPRSLGMSRPQNPQQYSDRLIFISELFSWALSYLMQYLMNRYVSESIAKNPLFLAAWFIFSFKQRHWVSDSVHAFVHHAWVQTYQPTWSANGPWKWFWKVTNFVPPVPFKTIMMHFCWASFFICLFANSYAGMMAVSIYWAVLYPRKELSHMWASALLWKIVSSLF